MAASETKPNEEAPPHPGETGKNDNSSWRENLPMKSCTNKNSKHCAIDMLFYALTIAIFAATVVTDFLVIIDHWMHTCKSWAYFTLGLVIVPSYFIQILSLRWYKKSSNLSKSQWISHVFHFSIVHRFGFLFNSAIKAMKTQLSPQQKDNVLKIENDAFTLNLFTSLLVSVPQIILQVYFMAILQHISFWTSASVIASLCSLTWALIAYALLSNRASHYKSQSSWSSMMIQGFWKGGVLASRIAALVLVSICFKTWIFVIFVTHTIGMTVWIIHQSKSFCIASIEELAYNSLIGSVYFFDFFRVTGKQVRYHICIFYSIIVVENTIFYVIYILSYKDNFPLNILIVSTVMVLGGNFVGSISMLIYFCMFQNFKSIKLCKRSLKDPEISLKVSPSKSISKFPKKKWNNDNIKNETVESMMNDVTTDKKSLLTNIVQNSDSLEKGILNTSFIKNDETNVTVQVVVEDNKITNIGVSVEKFQNHAAIEKKFDDFCCTDKSLQTADEIQISATDSLHRQKRRGICSEEELDLKSNDCNLDVESQVNSDIQKRRGICSLTQLGLKIVTDEDNYVEKSLSLDKLKSNSEVSLNLEDKSLDSGILDSLPITSLIKSDTSEVITPECILARGRLNTPVISESEEVTITNQLSETKDVTKKLEEMETMSQMTSVHDYENLLPLGVARPPWCIRSWKGYTDIETYIHDDSVVRDRRRDTLTSTATLSSDFSDVTYASLRKFMKRSRQDDYLDTLIYDLVDWESMSNKALSGEETTAATEIFEETQDQTNLFSAKPVVIDERGGMLALDTILEEREDQSSFPDLRMDFRNPATCSVSSLVATIDEIRKCTAENSPRHVYHRTESQWEDLEQKIFKKRAHLTKVLFSNDYSNVAFNPWANSLIKDVDKDKLNIIREMTNYCLKDSTGKTPLINAILSDSPILASKTEDQTCETVNVLEEDNVYVDMNALGVQKSNNKNCNELETPLLNTDILDQSNSALALSKEQDSNDEPCRNIRKKVAFQVIDEIINDSLENFSASSDSMSIEESNDTITPTFHTENELMTKSRPRRKFSLLRERFEPKFNEKIDNYLTAQKNTSSSSTQPSSLKKPVSVTVNNSDVNVSTNFDEERPTKKSIPVLESKRKSDDSKEKRSVFLKQVLSPPRLKGWGKKRTFSPNAKIISKAH